MPAWAQQVEISGRVVSTTDGTALGGVTVTVKNTAISTMTDNNGQYRIIATGDAVLVFTSVGFQTTEEAVRGRREVNTFLEPMASTLEEVDINAGYYRVKDRERTGSISRITADEIDRQPVNNPLLALHGRAPGVVINQQSGVPGNAVQIQIRGQNSLRADGNYPLYIIDGVPVDSQPISSTGLLTVHGSDPLNTINPANIESIEILKDADATAIYGSRGANGVVLITTKKGRYGGSQIDLSVSTGMGRIPQKLDMLNTDQYVAMRQEAFRNDGVEPSGNPTDFLAYAPDLMVWDTERYTDWQEELLGGTAGVTNAQLSLAAGSQTTSLRLGGGFQRETSVFPGDFGYRKGTALLRVDHRAFDERLQVSVAVNYGADNNKLFHHDMVGEALTLPPNAPAVYNADGTLNWADGTWVNPLSHLLKTNVIQSENVVANTGITYRIWQGLSLRANVGYTVNRTEEQRKVPISASNPDNRGRVTGSGALYNHATRSWLAEPQLIYKRNLRNSRLDVIIGGTFQDRQRDNLRISTAGYVNDALIGNINAAATVNVLDEPPVHYRYAALFGKVGYGIAERYFINLTGRRDGSSRFGPNKRFANFGAVGAAWLFSDEAFFKRLLPAINYGKLRASYGTAGSDQIGDYGYWDAYTATRYTYQGIAGLTPDQLFNADYSWEVNRKLDAELELRFFADRLTVAANWYRNRSSNQLVGYPLPAITGFTVVQANMDATIENRGWEFRAAVSSRPESRLSWETALNLTIPRSELLEYPGIESSTYAQTYVVGEPITIIKLYEALGLDENGIYQFADVDGNGTIQTADRQVAWDAGRRFYGGLRQTLSYGNWSLDALVEYVRQQGQGYMRHFSTPPGFFANQPVQVMDRWQGAGDLADIQRFTQSYSYYSAYLNAINSTLGIADASFVRLKTVSLGYRLPGGIANRLKLKNASLYVHGQNLWTITGYDGWDPDRPGSAYLPPLRMYTLGIQVSF